MDTIMWALSAAATAAGNVASDTLILAQANAKEIQKAVRAAPQALGVLREVRKFVDSDELQIHLSNRYRVAAHALVLFIICTLFSAIKFLHNFVNIAMHTTIVTVVVATAVGLWLVVDKNFKANFASWSKFLFTVAMSQASLLIWGILTLLTLRTYGSRGSVWEMMIITLMFPMTLFSNFLASKYPENEPEIHRTIKKLVFALTTLASLSHVTKMTVTTFGAEDGVTVFAALNCLFDIAKLVSTKTLMVIFLWFSAQTLEQKARDVTEIVMVSWTSLVSSPIFCYWMNLPTTRLETSQSATRALTGLSETMTSFRRTLRVAVDEVDEDGTHLRKRRISLWCYVFEDGYYLAVVILRVLVLSLMATSVIAQVGLHDFRGWMVVLSLTLQIFWELQNKPPTMDPLIVMIVRNDHYVDVVAGITMALKVRSACLGGEIEALNEDEQRVAEAQIHARLAPEIAKKVMRLRPVTKLCIALYQQYAEVSQSDEIDYKRFGAILLTSAPGLMEYWYSDSDSDSNSDASAFDSAEEERVME
jgi:hypothetical protein